MLALDRFKPILGNVPTVVEGSCEWDAAKAERNLAKHGVSFDEAMTALGDNNAVHLDDGSGSGRILAIGVSLRGRLLAVVYVERGERERIVSARPATRPENDIYTERNTP